MRKIPSFLLFYENDYETAYWSSARQYLDSTFILNHLYRSNDLRLHSRYVVGPDAGLCELSPFCFEMIHVFPKRSHLNVMVRK